MSDWPADSLSTPLTSQPRVVRVERRGYCKGVVARSRNGDTDCRTPKRRDRERSAKGVFGRDQNSSPPAMVASEAERKTVLSETGPVSPDRAPLFWDARYSMASKSMVREDVEVQVPPPARMMPGFEANNQDAWPQSSGSSARANSGVSQAVLPPGKRSGESVPSAAFARLTFPTDSPGRRDRDHRSAPDFPADTCPRTETAQETPQQGLLRQRTHDQEPLDVFKPQARIARPLVEFGPRRALVQYVGFRHDRPPRQRHLGVGQVPDK